MTRQRPVPVPGARGLDSFTLRVNEARLTNWPACIARCASLGAAPARSSPRSPAMPDSRAAECRNGWARNVVGDWIGGFQLKRIRSGVETLLAANGFSREIRGHLQSHGLTGVQARHYDGHDYMPEKLRAIGVLAKEVCKVEAARCSGEQALSFGERLKGQGRSFGLQRPAYLLVWLKGSGGTAEMPMSSSSPFDDGEQVVACDATAIQFFGGNRRKVGAVISYRHDARESVFQLSLISKAVSE